jgi:hypothetical protein
LVVCALENSECPHFEINRFESNAFPGLPFAVSFDQEEWTYGKTAPLAICHDARPRLKGVVVTIPENYYWNLTDRFNYSPTLTMGGVVENSKEDNNNDSQANPSH